LETEIRRITFPGQPCKQFAKLNLQNEKEMDWRYVSSGRVPGYANVKP
jgi:hypothetical protein